MKSIPRTCNASTDMFKHNVRLEDHSHLRGTLGRTWKYKVVNEDTKSLQRTKYTIVTDAACEDKIK